MPITKLTKLKAGLFATMLGCPSPVIATTVVVIATPHGMVVASDSKEFTVRLSVREAIRCVQPGDHRG